MPADLREAARWVVWKQVVEPGAKKPRKVPLVPGPELDFASSTNPETWRSFDAALKFATRKPACGVGFVLGQNGARGYVGVDLDHVRDAETGELAAEAAEIVRRFGTYAEVSPSGTGVKLIGTVPLDAAPELPRKKGDLDDGGEVEAYATGRYFTFTGLRLEDAPAALTDVSEPLRWLAGRYLARKAEEAGKTTGEPDEVDAPEANVRRARAYLRKLDPAVSGQRGHDATWKAALAVVRGFGLSTAQGVKALLDEFNPRCAPPWSERDLARKVREVRSKANVPLGYLVGSAPDRQASGRLPDEAVFFTAAEELRSRQPLGDAVATGLPGLDEVLEGGLRSGTHAVLVGPPESGKTTFAVHCTARWIDAAAHHTALVYARDEAPGAFINRLAQRLGFDRAALRRNDPETCARAAEALEQRWGERLQFLDPFRASLDEMLVKAAELRARGPLLDLVDSLQVAKTTAGERASSGKERIDAAMAVGSELASHGDLVLSLSQSSRAGYAEPKNGRDPRAEGSGSAGIEFNADLLLGFTSKAEDDPSAPRTVTIRKGRGGLAKGSIAFVIDRETTIVREVDRDASDEAERHAAAARLRPYQEGILAELRKAAAAGERRSGRKLEAAVPGNASQIRTALKALVIAGEVFVEEGSNRALYYYLASGASGASQVRPECVPDAPAEESSRRCVRASTPYKGDAPDGTHSTASGRAEKRPRGTRKARRTEAESEALP